MSCIFHDISVREERGPTQAETQSLKPVTQDRARR
jgi:hypothetical protein